MKTSLAAGPEQFAKNKQLKETRKLKKPKLRELKEAVRAVICGPYTTKFPFEPHTPPEGYRGKPEFHEDACIGCKACAEVCPADAIEVVDDVSASPPVRRLVIKTDQCIWCGHCERYCTTGKGVQLGRTYDLATVDRGELRASVEKELVLCEQCGEPVACRDHLKWIADKIGPMTYANATLFLVSQEESTGPHAPTVEAGGDRASIMRVLCPACQRANRTREVWG